jgi:gag-polypeptide of LTR copia-type/Pol polyprotein, beta-barrel domain
MMQSPPKHDIHKFREVRPKLSRDNWVSWKRELLATARDRGLYSIILGTDKLPNEKDSNAAIASGVQHVGDVPLTQKIEQWHDRNNAAYNQLLLCISSELQSTIDVTDVAADAWMILVGKFESKDPSKVSIVRTRYENYHMVDGQPVTSYLTTMKEFRSLLERMGEKIPDSTHAATILRNVPESWRSIAQTIRMISTNVDEIETKLEAHEADLDAVEISDQAATAFIALSNQHSNSSIRRQPTVNDHIFQSRNRHAPNPAFNSTRARVQRPTMSPIAQRSFFTCDNCGKYGHLALRCFASGGGMEDEAPWAMQHRRDEPQRVENSQARTAYVQPPPTQSSGASISRGASSTNPAQYRQSNDQRAMMAHISNATDGETAEISVSTNTSIFPSIEPNSHYWFIDSASTSHICGSIDLFDSIEDISPIIVETASGGTFTANKRGTVRITLRSEPSSGLDNIPITLLNVIYVPRVNFNILSVARMTNANVDVKFHNEYSTLSSDNDIFAQGSKINGLYAYEATTLVLPRERLKYSTEQDISTPIVPIHTPPPSPSPNAQLPDIQDTEDRELPGEALDTPDIREEEAQEIEGMELAGTAEEQRLGLQQDIEKDEHDDAASYGNGESHIETSNSNVSAFANDTYESGDELTAIRFTFALVCLAGWHVDNGPPDANSRGSTEPRVSDISGHFDIQDLGEPSLFSDSFAKRLDSQPGRSVATPIDSSLDIISSTNSKDFTDISYASHIDSTDYHALSTRSDTEYATYKCTQFAPHPMINHSNYEFIVFTNDDIGNIVRSISTFIIITLATTSWTAAYIHSLYSHPHYQHPSTTVITLQASTFPRLSRRCCA